MSKYKVGDRVVVISKEELKGLIGQGMFYIEPFCGRTVTIKEVDDDETYRMIVGGAMNSLKDQKKMYI